MTTHLKPMVERPKGDWMDRLRPSDWLYLCKEKQFASMVLWLPARPGHIGGELVFRRSINNYAQIPERWYVRGDGTGFDYQQLILPCEGWIPTEPAAEQITSSLILTIEHLKDRVERLERLVAPKDDIDQAIDAAFAAAARRPPSVIRPHIKRDMDYNKPFQE